MFFKKIISPLLIVSFFISFSFALEIPLSGAVKRGKSNSIVFVDMERAFNAHPMAERFKTELKNFAKTRKDAIEAMITQLQNMQQQLKEINVKIIEAQETGDEAALSGLAGQLNNMQKSIEEQREKIADLSKRTKTELALMEEKNSLAVLKDIEIVLKAVAKQYDSHVMLDKQSVLCGSEQCEDVTGEVIKRLEGR